MIRIVAFTALLGFASVFANAEPINHFCPISHEPITDEGGTIEYQGKEIGFCCPGCDDMFLSWNEKRRDEFVALAMAGKEPRKEADANAEPVDPATAEIIEINAYPLATCPVSGEEIGVMGDAIIQSFDGREVRFCCEHCPEKYEADRAKFDQKIDEQVAAKERLGYPLKTCPISGESLFDDDGAFSGVEVVYHNRLVRFCCEKCAGKFKKNPEPTLAKLDKAIVAQQLPGYPLTSCPVSGEELDNEAVNVIYMNRLYRLCCPSCVKEFQKAPARFVAVLDAAYADAQRAEAPKTCPLSGEELDDDAVEVVAGTKLIRFCCDKCAAKFKADPDKYAAEIGN